MSSLDKLEAMLVAARGEFVPGQKLAAAVGVPMMTLSNFIKELRRHRPNLFIIGERGKGYRIFVPEIVPPSPVLAQFETATKPRSGAGRSYRPPLPIHTKMRLSADLLDRLDPRIASQVSIVAMESGESFDETLCRLVAYGVEVHVDLVAAGENPLALKPLGSSVEGARA